MRMQNESSRLGRTEFFAMNNPIRNWRMRHQELPLLQRMLEARNFRWQEATIVDMGCGSGYSTYLFEKLLKPKTIHAFDIMPEQISLARRRQVAAEFQVADATSMPIESATCNAVFDFGILHHIPKWRTALSEAWRILMPGGMLFIEEPHKLFEWEELEGGIIDAGFQIVARHQWYCGYFRFFLCSKVAT